MTLMIRKAERMMMLQSKYKIRSVIIYYLRLVQFEQVIKYLWMMAMLRDLSNAQ